jgi:hypothetical protein
VAVMLAGADGAPGTGDGLVVGVGVGVGVGVIIGVGLGVGEMTVQLMKVGPFSHTPSDPSLPRCAPTLGICCYLLEPTSKNVIHETPDLVALRDEGTGLYASDALTHVFL